MTCIICGKKVNKSGEFLYLKPGGEEVGLCGKPKRCEKLYEEGARG